jgi:hypothetical protein
MKRLTKVANRLFSGWLLFVFALGGATYLMCLQFSSAATNPKSGLLLPVAERWLAWLPKVIIFAQVALGMLLVSGAMIVGWRFRREAWKRRQVLAAVQQLDAKAWEEQWDRTPSGKS